MRIPSGLLAALFGLCANASALAADKVTVQLDFVIRGNHGVFFVGQSEGFFARDGIEITAINKGTGSVNTMRQIGFGRSRVRLRRLSDARDRALAADARGGDRGAEPAEPDSHHFACQDEARRRRRTSRANRSAYSPPARRFCSSRLLRLRTISICRRSRSARSLRRRRISCCSVASIPFRATSTPNCPNSKPRRAVPDRSTCCSDRIMASSLMDRGWSRPKR